MADGVTIACDVSAFHQVTRMLLLLAVAACACLVIVPWLWRTVLPAGSQTTKPNSSNRRLHMLSAFLPISHELQHDYGAVNLTCGVLTALKSPKPRSRCNLHPLVLLATKHPLSHTRSWSCGVMSRCSMVGMWSCDGLLLALSQSGCIHSKCADDPLEGSQPLGRWQGQVDVSVTISLMVIRVVP